LQEYRIPELMKAEVQRHIDELADDGFIVPSTSLMASPLVCVLKGKDGKGEVRLAVDMLIASHIMTRMFMPNLNDIIHKVGSANFITTTDCRCGYWQLEDRWVDCVRLRRRSLGMDTITFWSSYQWQFFCSLCSNYTEPR